jgi:hypothetical protein
MKTELMRKLFELKHSHLILVPSIYDGSLYLEQATQSAFESFQAACNMFLQHVEVLEDGAQMQKGDTIQDEILGGGGNNFYTIMSDDRAEIENAEYLKKRWKAKIITRNGKYAIRESDLMGEK